MLCFNLIFCTLFLEIKQIKTAEFSLQHSVGLRNIT